MFGNQIQDMCFQQEEIVSLESSWNGFITQSGLYILNLRKENLIIEKSYIEIVRLKIRDILYFQKSYALFAPHNGFDPGKQPLENWKDAIEWFSDHEKCLYHKI